MNTTGSFALYILVIILMCLSQRIPEAVMRSFVFCPIEVRCPILLPTRLPFFYVLYRVRSALLLVLPYNLPGAPARDADRHGTRKPWSSVFRRGSWEQRSKRSKAASAPKCSGEASTILRTNTIRGLRYIRWLITCGH